VESEPGKGARFTVLFPARQAAPPVPAPAEPAGAALDGAGTVLVVDDEPVVREMVKRALELYGYTVLVADCGSAAIHTFQRHAQLIDLVILDLSMPGMTGEETLPELRKIRPDIKVVLSSGYSEAATLTLFEGQHISGFIQKPYTASVIAEKVKGALTE
jgi:CheY-like chemotaxis protein